MDENLKKSRSARKGALTREINTTVKFIDAGMVKEVELRIGKLKEKFTAFEVAHDAFHETLEDEAEISTSDKFFDDVQDQYINAMKRAESINPAQVNEVREPEPQGNNPTSNDLNREILNMMNVSNLRIEPYDGDPLLFHSFFAIFDENVDKRIADETAKMTLLLDKTTGDALRTVRPFANMKNGGYAKAREALAKRFGNPHVIADQVISNLTNGGPIKSAKDLVQLSDDLNGAMNVLGNLGKLREVDTQSSIVTIVNRLQPYLRNKWRRQAMDEKHERDSYPGFEVLVEFVEREAFDAADPIYGLNMSGRKDCKSKTPKPTSLNTNTSASKGKPRVNKPCILCNDSHRLFYCSVFKSMKPSDRLKLVNEKHLCHNCLLDNHATTNCRKTSVCSVPNCGAKHTKFIHVDAQLSTVVPGASNSTFQAEVSNNCDKVNENRNEISGVMVPIVPVVVNGECIVNAILDTASNTSFCTQMLADRLRVKGNKVTYLLNTMSRTQECKSSTVVNLDLMSQDGTNCLGLSDVYVVDRIPIRVPKIDVSLYPHLHGLPVQNEISEVHILIGQDHCEALVPLEIRKGRRGEPFAVKTMFGWSFNGPVMSNPVSKEVISHFVNANLEDEVNRLWQLEDESSLNLEPGLSENDKAVVKLWDSCHKIVDEHYELPIPWKVDSFVPNNLKVAEARLKSLSVNLIKSGIYARYDAEIKTLLEKGYAEPVGDLNCQSDKVWYLPHHAVTNENKPEKIRVVFDCASRFEGESLNDKCLQGPDVNNKLLHVLLRFREHQCAIMGDVEAMYHQVLVPEDDRDALRFLWYVDDQIKHFRMTRHIFGGVWSSSAATYALRRTVVDYGGADDMVDETILKSFYVDDCLRSVPSVNEAINIIQGAVSLLAKGGFKLTKFLSSHDDVLKVIPESDHAKEVKDLSFNSNSKALGVRWDFSADEFFFDMKVDEKKPVTRRNVLSVISSMFDPMGLVSPVLIGGKVLFQNATRLKLGWDEELPSDLKEEWYTWLRTMASVKLLKVPRCVKPQVFDDALVELHHFSDASMIAFGSCCYVRCVNKQGEIHVSLLYSKGKVAPIKTISIPRLELQAALLSARIDAMLRREMTLDLAASYFWVDSEIALKYIKNNTRRFHVYVANRVGEIRRLTNSDQWHHVPGVQNPADIISRGQSAADLDKCKWFNGPDFLRTYKGEWKQGEFDVSLPEDDAEVKRDVVSTKQPAKIACVSESVTHPLDALIAHYSDWTKLKRAVAWLMRLRRILCHENNARDLMSVGEVNAAEILILQHVQSSSYEAEMTKLQSGQSVGKSSSLKDLSPLLDQNGLLCVGGRLRHANLQDSQKHPYIIPHDHDIALKIVREIHNDAHLGTEWTLSLLRTKYWITRARSVVKRVRHSCITCRRLNSSTCSQKMADLPPERLKPGEPPFCFVGVDYFGPFLVKVGRSEAKRYGCVYTCLTTRAIHIELINSLDTDSFLNGLRRFMARRGSPKKIFSDNGTNFVGGQSELKRGLKELQFSKVHQYCVSQEVEWVFNPPHASHMGGVWERLIRTIRKVLSGLLMNSKQRLTDEVLSTVLCEVESIINGRPITKVSSEANDFSPLTPNHLLLLRKGPDPPPGVFLQDHMYRRRWKYTQHLVEQFWRRWIREYLPELQRRQKWTKESRNIKKDDLVLLCDENTPRGLWPLGIIVQTMEGRDGLVRSVKVRTKSSVFTRPITKVVLLEGD